jgi:predicted transcriptional regulator of viral defense system
VTTKRTARVRQALDRLKVQGVFTRAEAVAAGVSQPTLTRLAAAGELMGLGEGLYYHPETAAVDVAELDFIVACKHFGPDSIIGGITSLFHYRLITQVPGIIWVIVPPEVKTTSPRYRCLRSTHDPKIGVDDRGLYRIATIERSIVEAFAYHTKMGLSTALYAARRSIHDNLTTEKKLHETAEALGVWSYISKYWEAVRDDRFD